MRARELLCYLAAALMLWGLIPILMLRQGIVQAQLVKIAAGALILSGFGFCAYAGIYLRRHGRGGLGPMGSLRLMPATRHLVTDGPYALCRNPMHQGLVIGYIGCALLSAQLWAWLVPAAAVPGAWLHAILIDEPRLKRDFPAAYAAWADKVPRFGFGFNIQKQNK